MSFLSNLTGEYFKNDLETLAQQIGGTFVDGGWGGRYEVKLNYRNTEIILDTHRRSLKKHEGPYKTIIKCPFVTTNKFTFSIVLENAFSHAGKIFGFNDIEIGNHKFDDEFYLKSKRKAYFIPKFRDYPRKIF